MAERGGSHEQHVEAGRKGGKASHGDEKMSTSGSKGGESRSKNSTESSHEKHVRAGEQSHKNTPKKS